MSAQQHNDFMVAGANPDAPTTAPTSSSSWTTVQSSNAEHTPAETPLSPLAGPSHSNNNNSNANINVAEIVQAAVTAVLNAHDARPKPRRQDYDKPPTYNVQELEENATGSQIQDWISGIKRGNEERLYCLARS